MERDVAGQRLRGVAMTLMHLADRLQADEPIRAEAIDLAVAQLKGVRVRAFGPRRLGPGSGRERLKAYLMQHVGDEIPGEELAEIAGISEWARRVRELRMDGLQISQPAVGIYRLDAPP